MSDAAHIWIDPKYSPLICEKNRRYYLVSGGRGSGKSYAVATLLISLLCERGQRILYTRYTMTSAELSIIPEFREKIEALGLSSIFLIRQRDIVNLETGSSIIFSGIRESSGNQTAKLKSLAGITAWVLDEAEELTDEETFDKIDMSVRSVSAQNRIILILNPAYRSHWIFKRFYEPYSLPDGFNGVTDTAVYIHTTYADNLRNLPDDVLRIIDERRISSPLKHAHIDLGHWCDESEGALWSQEIIDAGRVWSHPPLVRIVVAVDPAVTASTQSDETGIVAAGIDASDNLYILGDYSGIYSPLSWAREVVRVYQLHDADRVIGEVNQGGDLIESNLRTVDKDIPYSAVRATRGKAIRAEPIAALYEAGRVHHVGQFPRLEEELTTWSPASDYSPDRLDALVWAITSLTTKKAAYQPPIVI